jgi:hypothetical protein
VKYLCLFLLLSFASCVNGQKTYMCGERACIDKKEFKQYFAENLIVEIQTIKDKKKTSVDLVKLNTSNSINKKNITKEQKLNQKLDTREQKLLVKAEKKRIKKERKIKLIEEKKKIKEKKKLAKFLIKDKKKINIFDTKKEDKETDIPLISPEIKTKKNIAQKTAKTLLESSVCVDIINCDIDEITKLLIEKGKEKDFPNITSK